MNPDQVYLVQMESLQENYILKKLVIWLTPCLLIGLLGLLLPFFYAILPVHAADICLCSFYAEKIKDGRAYVALTQNDFVFLEVLNLLSQLGVNFAFLFALIWMVYKIRHINDDTQIKMECSVIVAWWLTLSIL